MRIKIVGILSILFAITSCDYIDCNYEKLTEKEYEKIAELNRNAKRIDTMYNDRCLKGFFYVYLKEQSAEFETEREIEQILAELRNENMERDIWVFNKSEVFLYRLFYNSTNSKNKIIKTDLQYPNQ